MSTVCAGGARGVRAKCVLFLLSLLLFGWPDKLFGAPYCEFSISHMDGMEASSQPQPAHSRSGHARKNALAAPHPSSSLAFRWDRQLLPQSEVLNRKISPVTKRPESDRPQDATRIHLTASDILHHGLKTTSEASNRLRSVAKAIGRNASYQQHICLY